MGVHECLLEHGYPETEPPSRDAFVDGTDWNVYGATPEGGIAVYLNDDNLTPDQELQEEIQRTCPLQETR